MTRIFYAAAVLCLLVGATGYFAHSSDEKAKIDRKQRLAAENAVAVLPPGIREQWIEYVQKRVDLLVKPTAGSIAIVADQETETTVLLSRSTPYKLSCEPSLGLIEFGDGPDAPTVTIWTTTGGEENQPSLDVSEFSIAANELSKALCERASTSLNAILQK